MMPWIILLKISLDKLFLKGNLFFKIFSKDSYGRLKNIKQVVNTHDSYKIGKKENEYRN